MKNKTKYMILIIVILIVVLVAGALMLNNKNNKKNNIKTNLVNEVVETPPVIEDEEGTYYYICEDDETTLSVRDKESGNRIDRLACGSKVNLLSISETKTDICDNWYYVSYTKYTSGVSQTTKGYVCGNFLRTRKDNVTNVFTDIDLSLVRNDVRYIKINSKYTITTKRDEDTMTLLINDKEVLKNKVSCLGTITQLGDYLVVSNNKSCGNTSTIELYDEKATKLDSIDITNEDNLHLDLTYTVKNNKLSYKLINYQNNITVNGYTIKYCNQGNYEQESFDDLDLNYELGKLYQTSIENNKFTTSTDSTTYTLNDYIKEIGKSNICISK